MPRNEMFYEKICCCRCAAYIVCWFIVLVSVASCRSSRVSVEEKQEEIHTISGSETKMDTVDTATATRETCADSVVVLSHERTAITLTRDSAGRVVGICAERVAALDANIQRRINSDRLFHGINASQSSETATKVDSIAKTQEKTKKEIHSGPTLECIFGWGLVAFVILAYLGDWLYRLWKKKEK